MSKENTRSHLQVSTNGKDAPKSEASIERSERQVIYTEQGTDWIADITRVLGKPRKTITPEENGLSGQETAIYYLPLTGVSSYDKDFEGTILTVTRDRDDIDPAFKIHISCQKRGEDEKTLFHPEIIAIHINFRDKFVDFWAASETEDLFIAQVSPSKVILKSAS